MSILLDAEKLRRKLEKLDAKRDATIKEYDVKREALLAAAPAPVLALVQASRNYSKGILTDAFGAPFELTEDEKGE